MSFLCNTNEFYPEYNSECYKGDTDDVLPQECDGEYVSFIKSLSLMNLNGMSNEMCLDVSSMA